jgi:hypothetical protein
VRAGRFAILQSPTHTEQRQHPCRQFSGYLARENRRPPRRKPTARLKFVLRFKKVSENKKANLQSKSLHSPFSRAFLVTFLLENSFSEYPTDTLFTGLLSHPESLLAAVVFPLARDFTQPPWNKRREERFFLRG